MKSSARTIWANVMMEAFYLLSSIWKPALL